MRDDDPAVGDLGRALRQHRGDVFVGQPVKPVAPDALLVQRIGQRKSLRHLGRGAVKRGVEARDLRQFRVQSSAPCGSAPDCAARAAAPAAPAPPARQAVPASRAPVREWRAPPCTTRWPSAARRRSPSCSRAQGSIAGSTSLGDGRRTGRRNPAARSPCRRDRWPARRDARRSRPPVPTGSAVSPS